MKFFIGAVIRTAITFPSILLLWMLIYFAFGRLFWLSLLLSFAGGFLVNRLVKWLMVRSFLKEQQLSRKDYLYIRKNLKEADRKIKRLQKTFFSVRSIGTFKLFYDMNKVIRKIHALVKKEPKRFYQAESFYFYHLDSMVELAEKYALLNGQPVKNKKMSDHLQDTEEALKQLGRETEKDLYHMLSTDLDELDFELAYAKHSLERKSPSGMKGV
ncbi:protein XpaC [Weizmannia acidilactici]|uniref:Protein XpaC n=1 Tax=Weizmannia acidilactici TaxID=2607726 RepID=A0A5J4JG27_9BACI|nr:5-bromo-4-chloroindolyl phosphate hydrolysis family protein [Weizmannia acidilactici]GER66096.1 protein XpaC [Weizmannia acidilactici]GER69268.1 protein XpaC [Weizmannia acidilactici]GER72405.1 protein XpaC [Weizmannia acidilactici]